ncbi:MotA/TolQ/ExbB proton channel family protein [Chungangia koreensis]|uniref:MotA/TolQ/ExbB proton channel family protein n=1 Tax=Chungangia koreensis TaxID=752657 RepID=A0ABV8X1K8_9LACT
MDFLYPIFESVFQTFQKISLGSFTGYYLLGQLLIFTGLLVLHLVFTYNESKVMEKVKKELEKLEHSKASSDSLNQNINEIFQSISKSSTYRKQWDKYYDRIKTKDVDERIRIEPFFGLDVMYGTIGRRQILDLGGGLHVSLGVLGTFLGLSMGLSGLNTIDPELLREGVTGLISGMKVAFYTSVFGLVLSVLWTFIDRFITSKIDKKIDWHSNELNLLLNADDEEIFLNRLEKITQQQSDQMKTILTDALEHVMQPFVQTVNQGNQALTGRFDELNLQMKEQSDTSKEHLELFKNQTNDVSQKLIEGITAGTKDSIDQFIEVMAVSKQSQSDMLSSVQQVVDQFEQASSRQEQLFGNTEKMLETFSTLSNEVKSTQSSYQESFSNLEGLSSALKEMQMIHTSQLPVQQALMEQNQQFMFKSEELVDGFIKFGKDLEQMQKDVFENMLEKADSVSNRFERLASELANSTEKQLMSTSETAVLVENIKQSIEVIKPISQQLQDSIGTIESLTDGLQNMQILQQELIPELSTWNEETSAQISEFVRLSESNLMEMKNQLEETKGHWSNVSSDFEETRQQLGNSLKEFSVNIENGVTKTFQLFDKELVEVVGHFKGMSDTYLETQEEMTEAMERLLKVLHQDKAGAGV